ncbi:hypothetical protein [Vibrio rarus]|uniref:hypothetical protein n=1 Tax=Vibrio rarus TaxID=413403 RepID=UPI0021C45174|nr:hypothetical protein [Vibrio rarus]
MTILLGFLIVGFNVLGYGILFPNHAYSINPFSVLLFVTEAAVLMWTSKVIEGWYTTSWVLKFAMFILVPSFWFISYVGINSYLNDLATGDVKIVKTAENNNATREKQIEDLKRDIADNQIEINSLRERNLQIDDQIHKDSTQLSKINIQDSERRKTAKDCSLNPDCSAAVKNFTKQLDALNRAIETSQKNKESNSNNIRTLESSNIKAREQMSELRNKVAQTNHAHAETKSAYSQKKDMYVAIVNKVSSWFGVKFDDPFGAFVSFLSALIYPVYFILNLLSSLNTKEHIERRIKRLDHKKYNIEIRKILLTKLLKYLRVWAHRRNKTLQVTTTIEVPIEIEKEIERIVEVEKIVEVEIEKEVERIVEVEKIVEVEIEKIVEVPVEMEVPVYVERIHKVSEPMVIKEPQIIIHERIVPIPENITANELEELLDAESRSQKTTRVKPEEVVEESTKERAAS